MRSQSAYSYRTLIFAAIVGPALIFSAVAVWSWNLVRRDVDSSITRGAAILHEQGLRLLQVDQQLLQRIDDRVAGMEWSEIIREEVPLRSFLESAVSQVPEVNSAFIVDVNGTPQVSSGFFPLLARLKPSITAEVVRERDYFRTLSEGQPLVVGRPHKSIVTGESVIDVAARLSSRDGSFRGAVVLIVSAGRLASGWKSVTQPGDSVSLVAPDGTVLARYPSAPLGADEAPPHFTAVSMKIITGADSGIFDSPPSAIDGIVRRAGFRKLGIFPLYIVYAISHANIRQQWYPTVMVFGALSIAGAGGLLLAALAVIRRARSEEQLRRFSELLIEHSIDGIIGKDNSLRYTVWSRGMELMTAIPRDHVIGRRTEDVFESNAVGTASTDVWLDALAGRTSAVTDVPYNFPQTGKHGYYDQVLSPLRDGQGVIIGAIAFVHDATERHRVEAELRQAQKMEAIGQLTGGIAHDFNNLLTVIFGNLETVQRRTATDSQSMRFIDAATRAAERAATLTDRLLAFARRQPLVRQALNLNHIVAGMSDLLHRTLGEQITIETVLTGGAWRVFADANQLENALLNLAVNARDAMPNGGRLTIKTGVIKVDETYVVGTEDISAGEYGLLEVSDTGIGMDDSAIAHAFEPFFTTKEIGKGSGLGLSQVYGFAKQLGGHVTIASRLGHGTTVTVYLPRVTGHQLPDDRTKATYAAPLPRACRGHETILVVEDDEAVRNHVQALLQELGYTVLVAENGSSALDILENTGGVELLFTDIGLPGELSGFDLADEILTRRPGMKVVFATGYAAKAADYEKRAKVVDNILLKPFTFSALAGKVREILDVR